MKLAASTLAFQGWTLEEAVKACRENGIEAMEIRMNFHPWSDLSLPDEEYRKNYEYLKENGIAVSDLGTGIRMRGYTAEGLEELERCSRIANIMHCCGLRIMLGNKRKLLSENVPDIDYDGLVRWLVEADAILEQHRTQIWIETHNEFATGKSLRELLDRHSFRNIKLLWDIMHPLESGEQPEETLKFMKPDLVHVHIKDGTPWENPDMSSWKYTGIGEGSVPIKAIVDMIRADGYEGYFSLEWESAWREELRGAGFGIPDVLGKYRGYMRKILMSD